VKIGIGKYFLWDQGQELDALGEFRRTAHPAERDVTRRASKSAELPLPDGHTIAFLVPSGGVTVNG
jgi:hypothetical protein